MTQQSNQAQALEPAVVRADEGEALVVRRSRRDQGDRRRQRRTIVKQHGPTRTGYFEGFRCTRCRNESDYH